MPSPSPKPSSTLLIIDVNSSANDTESASNNSMSRYQYAQGIPKFNKKRALTDIQYEEEYLRKLGKVVHDRSILGQFDNLFNPFSRTSLNPFRSKHAPPKGTNMTRKRKHIDDKNLYKKHKLKLPKVGGNKNRTKYESPKYESPPKLKIRIDRYTSESNDDSTDIKQKELGFTKRDSPSTLLRNVNKIINETQKGVSNNPFQIGNEHIFKEQRAMIEHERRRRTKKTNEKDERKRRGGNKRKTRGRRCL
jgi:hypothetical protein